MLNFCDFIQVYVFTRNHHLKANYISFSIFSSGGIIFHWSGTVLAIIVEGHLSNIPMKLERNWPRGGVGIK